MESNVAKIDVTQLKVMLSRNLTSFSKLELNALVEEAKKDPFVGKSVEWWGEADKQVIFYNNKVIGFYCPRKTKMPLVNGKEPDNKYYNKPGTIFINKDYRSMGIPLYVISKWCKSNLPCMVYIDNNNEPSKKLFLKLGFIPNEQELKNIYTGNNCKVYTLDNLNVINQLVF